jgi:GDP-4-dehydro-6-deoxy-D-mannose reductase
MRILVTGAAGFVGKHLLQELINHEHQPIAVDLRADTEPQGVTWHECDILDPVALTKIVVKAKPDACIHLAGIAFVPAAKTHPEIMLTINILGTLNILNALSENCPSCRTLTISTGHVYGTPPPDVVVTENTPLHPVSLYAITKAAADSAALGFTENNRLPVMTARPNNHSGPGQSPNFVIPGFINQAKSIAAGKSEALLSVGNLESVRDFTDVRDVVRAYRLIIEKGRPGEAYNIASCDTVSIGDVLSEICKLTNIDPEIEIDPEKFRPKDHSPVLDTTKLKTDTGWQPEYTRTQTLTDMIKSIE